MSETRRVDAVVVGAGTAGANAAHQLARRGLRVILLERRAADAGGAQWHNGVLDWQFERAGVAPPEPPERSPGGRVTHLVGPDGHPGVTVTANPVVRADMGLLGRRLRALAAGSGAEIIDRVTAVTPELRGDRIVAVDLAVGPDLRPLRLEADLFVDTSGRHGVLRRHSPPLRRWCPPVRGDELCTAADHHVEITDPDAAKGFLERHGANPGETVTMVGNAGGFSTRAITVGESLDEASILVGCLADGRHSSGPRLLAAARADEPWIGESLSGGAGVIPLRRPYARISAPGLALVGDAACQVFPAHGSGIGIGLIAGTMLAEAVAGASDPGRADTVWAYQAAFQHEHGGLLAAFDAFRRMSTALGSDGVARMIRAGLLSEAMATAGLDQSWQAPEVADIPRTAARMAGAPGVAIRMLPMLARGAALRPLGAAHPSEPDERALEIWDRRVRRLLGPLPR